MRSSFGAGGRFRTVFDPDLLQDYFGTLQSIRIPRLAFRSTSRTLTSVENPLNPALSRAAGQLAQLVEHLVYTGRVGQVSADLRIGADVTSTVALKANNGVCSPGFKLHGDGFIVMPEHVAAPSQVQITIPQPSYIRTGFGDDDAVIFDYRNGRDLASRPRGVLVIDLYGLSETEVRDLYREVCQRVLATVKPHRDQNNRASYRDNCVPRHVWHRARNLATVRSAIATPGQAWRPSSGYFERTSHGKHWGYLADHCDRSDWQASPTTSIACCKCTSSKCAYRAVDFTEACPSSLPIMGVSPSRSPYGWQRCGAGRAAGRRLCLLHS